MLNAKEQRYLSELAAEIINQGGFGEDLMAAIAAAHAKRRAFSCEILNQHTRRARMAKKVLGPSVFIGIHVRAGIAGLDRECEAIE